MVIETEGVGPTYAGTALGVTMALSGLGNFLAPPLGNRLAVLWPGAPFALWAVLAAAGMACLGMVKTAKREPDCLPAVSPAGGQIR